MPSYQDLQIQKKNKLSAASDLINQVLNINSHEFFQRAAWGEVNFAECIDIVEFELKPLLSLVQSYAGRCFDIDDLNRLVADLEPLQNAFDQIGSFRLDRPDSITSRDQLRQNLINTTRTLLNRIQPKALSLLLSDLKSESRFEEQKNFSEQARKLIDSVNNTYTDILAKQSEMQSVVDSARQAVGKLGVGENAQIFSDQSDRLFAASIAWLIATVLVTATSLCVAAYFYFHPLWTGNDMTYTIQIVVAKIIIVSMLISATVWCGKNYRAVAHEAAVNKHRANALATFRTFVEATDEPDVRNAVLLEATRSIFSQAPSGYLDKSDTSGSDTRILEVVRSLSSLAKPTH